MLQMSLLCKNSNISNMETTRDRLGPAGWRILPISWKRYPGQGRSSSAVAFIRVGIFKYVWGGGGVVGWKT